MKEEQQTPHEKEESTTDRYLKQYGDNFVKKWDELIDWEKRSESEGSFFIDILNARNAYDILDAATGTGFHSVRLLQNGFKVTSADGSGNMLIQAFSNALEKGYILNTVHTDWRRLSRDLQGEYDAIFCLGNSFTHLFQEQDRRKVLAEFYSRLRPHGTLVIDHRNYDKILNSLDSNGHHSKFNKDFSSKHKYYYCGENVVADPVVIMESLVRFEYTFSDQSVFHLDMFPLSRNYMLDLLQEHGFGNVETYADFQETYTEADPDFFIHIANKT